MTIRFNINTVTPDLAVAALRDQKRADKAAQIPDSDIKEVAPDFYEVKSQSRKDLKHEVDLRGKGSCTCEDWTLRQVECIHLKKVRVTKRNEVRVLEAGTVKPFMEALAKDLERDAKLDQARAIAEVY